MNGASVTDVADAVTKSALGVLTVVAAVAVLVGAANAVLGRRREQIVVADVSGQTNYGVDTGGDAGSLSPWLRQRVQAALSRQSLDARHIVDEVLGRDIALRRVPVRTTLDAWSGSIAAAADDALATLAQGLKAVAPDQADGLLGALSVVLPRRRGYRVSTVVLTRGESEKPRFGLAIEVATLDGPPLATVTFWEPVPISPDADSDREPARERLLALVEPAAHWIALRLLMLRLDIAPTGPRRRRPQVVAIRSGMRGLFVGGLCQLAMGAHPQHVIAFGEDAVEELERAEKALPGYHRPWETCAAVREHIGRTLLRRSLVKDARRQFAQAVNEWETAENFISTNPGKPTRLIPGTRGAANAIDGINDERERLRVRRLLCQLRSTESGSRNAVVQEVARHPVPNSGSLRTLYNAACLYAALGGEYLTIAYEMLGRSVLSRAKTNLHRTALDDDDLKVLPDLAAFLERLVALRPAPLAPIDGEAARALIMQAFADTVKPIT